MQRFSRLEGQVWGRRRGHWGKIGKVGNFEENSKIGKSKRGNPKNQNGKRKKKKKKKKKEKYPYSVLEWGYVHRSTSYSCNLLTIYTID